MKLLEALGSLENLKHAVANLDASFDMEVMAPSQPINLWLPNWAKTLHGVEATSDPKIKECFGVYLIATHPDNEVIYVGKATPGMRSDTSNRTINYHLSGRMFIHIGSAPNEPIPGVMLNRGALLTKRRMTEAAKKCVQDGALLIALVRIEPWQAASYVETYLQAAIMLKGELPLANDRIG